MAAIDYDTELRRAGAHSTRGWRRFAFTAQRHVLGTVGLIIMVVFVLTAAMNFLVVILALVVLKPLRARLAANSAKLAAA